MTLERVNSFTRRWFTWWFLILDDGKRREPNGIP